MQLVDNFAGGGGASLGIEQALGRPVDIAVNHDAEAVAMHRANHPRTAHYLQDVWNVDPAAIARRGPISLAWFSPDCTHHSKAKGSAPIRREGLRSRDLAWVVIRWAREAQPAVIMLENVEEFANWGPLVAGRPDKTRAGQTFRHWIQALRDAGYDVEWRELRACDYGAPTFRKRLFVIARRDGLPIAWPDPTHGPGRNPYRTAAECIDWNLPVHSIFLSTAEGRKAGVRRPLADNTLSRIARGLRRYVIEADRPFIVPVTHAGDRRIYSIDDPVRTVTAARRGELALVTAHMAQHNTGMTGHACTEPLSTIVGRGSNQNLVTCLLTREFGASTGQTIDRPAATVMPRGGGKTGLVAASLSHLHGSNTNGGDGDLRRPMNAILAGGQHKALLAAFLTKYYGTNVGSPLHDPCPTATARARFGLVTVDSQDYTINDIGMRMLAARELFRAQGFPDDYRIQALVSGKMLTKEAQIRMCGNSVCPQMARALVTANVLRSTLPLAA